MNPLKKQAKVIWKKKNLQMAILSYHLSKKMKELKVCLSNSKYNLVEVNAKIYDSKQHHFNKTHPNLLYREFYSLN